MGSAQRCSVLVRWVLLGVGVRSLGAPGPLEGLQVVSLSRPPDATSLPSELVATASTCPPRPFFALSATITASFLPVSTSQWITLQSFEPENAWRSSLPSATQVARLVEELEGDEGLAKVV